MHDFIIIVNKNCINWKDIWPMYMEGKIDFGYTRPDDMILPKSAEQWTRIKDRYDYGKPMVDGSNKYTRILIQKNG